ncbi:RNA-binding domain-containing protein [Leptolyngbya sp. BC1307]|uniref:RNA-binding domain-containing protein n=1 Tax=Leptolyngbya sp. BC1307 TaxID=2029589 RepID=UPI001483CCF9|nr:RNA-binding domain-containing protein [Leptolyngbya sp. BC1307]
MKHTPREVFDDPHSAWHFITHPTDDGFEGQHFDRKQAGNIQGDGSTSKNSIEELRKTIVKTVSAFANGNVEGGLLVIGVSSTGEVIGIDHLSEDQRNALTNLDQYLRSHAAEVREIDCKNRQGEDKKLCLIYSADLLHAVCETIEQQPKAWIRRGAQSLPLRPENRDQIRIRKGLLNTDNLPWCPFEPEDLDADVVTEFRRVFRPDFASDFTDERLLREAGAIVKKEEKYWFTLPGLLFFASNPQRAAPSAFLRLLKFIVPHDQYRNRGTPSLDRDFRGSITKQIRSARTFLREGAFFDRLQYRRLDGGFSEEMELPAIAVDEAIVNAVAHRDYHAQNPINCEHYTDAFVVKNPGRIRQQNYDLPDKFDLSHTVLDSLPRNRKLIEWLRLMEDPGGKSFVQAISEGTKQMAKEMADLKLPPPAVQLLENETILCLKSNAAERKAAYLASIQVPKTAFMNAYLLTIRNGDRLATSDEVHLRLREIAQALENSLVGYEWHIDRSSFSRITAHKKGIDLPTSDEVRRVVRFYPAYRFQIHEMLGHAYIVVDYTCQVLNVVRAHEVVRYIEAEKLLGNRCIAKVAEDWSAGRIESLDTEWATVRFFESEETSTVQTNAVIPSLSLSQIEDIVKQKNISFDLHVTVKQHSLASSQSAARKRAEKIANTADYLSTGIFPLISGELEIGMSKEPLALSEIERSSRSSFHFGRLSEPTVEFKRRQQSTDVRDGITKYGSYDSESHDIEIVPVCLISYTQSMHTLISRLKTGKYKYRGSERTFSTRFSYSTVVGADSLHNVGQEVNRLLSEKPQWCGNDKLNRLFLVHTPEAGYALDDESSPYFVIKRRLLEAGIPCQMVDTKTLTNADWKDLNLALNITAKCGVTPWVLPENIPDADFFVGLSYTQSRDGRKILGFANVFNSYGKWEFYAGNTAAFDVQERSEHLSRLANSALERLKRAQLLPASPSLIFHHSARISKEDYRAILNSVRIIAPDASVSFVWINSHNNFRLFDSRVETDGSIQRGSFVPISRRRTLLSTTGHNVYRKALGTPRPLEITADRYWPNDTEPKSCDSRATAIQILSLTKLNLASTDSFTAEPITTKYAGDIAYLTAAFLRQREPFRLHEVLEPTPWFI